MSRKQAAVQKSLQTSASRLAEIPRPLEQLSKTQMERKQCISKLMTHVLKYLTNRFADSGFEWLLPVVLSKSTDPLWPDPGSSIEKRVEVEIYGKPLRTMLSMIVHKMVACSLAYPKLFTLSPNVRIEKTERANSGIHAYEFTQLDFEVRHASSIEIRNFVEKMLRGLIKDLKRHMNEELMYLGRSNNLKDPEIPFRVFDRKELENTHGKSWEEKLMLGTRDPVWVTNVPREFYDYEDLKDGTWDNYDLLLPQYGEVLSGSRREWEYNKIVRKMERDGVKEENYEVLLMLAKEGRLKPSAGAGIGLERLVSWIAGAKHIGETQPFPKIPGMVYDL
jgi:asparaginyl-tRNA synthetase